MRRLNRAPPPPPPQPRPNPSHTSTVATAARRRRGQASVNPKAETVEELQSRRKRLHLGMVKLAREDLERQALQAQDAFKVSPAPPRPAD